MIIILVINYQQPRAPVQREAQLADKLKIYHKTGDGKPQTYSNMSPDINRFSQVGSSLGMTWPKY